MATSNTDDYIHVFNVPGTSNERFVIPKLPEHYKRCPGNYSGKKCRVWNCRLNKDNKYPLHTAHVRVDENLDGKPEGKWKLTRICPGHNSYTQTKRFKLHKGNPGIVSLEYLRATRLDKESDEDFEEYCRCIDALIEYLITQDFE